MLTRIHFTQCPAIKAVIQGCLARSIQQIFVVLYSYHFLKGEIAGYILFPFSILIILGKRFVLEQLHNFLPPYDKNIFLLLDTHVSCKHSTLHLHSE